MPRELRVVIVANVEKTPPAVLQHGDPHRRGAHAADIAVELSHFVSWKRCATHGRARTGDQGRTKGARRSAA